MLGVSSLYILCILLLWLSHFFFQSGHLQWFSLFLVGFGPYVFSVVQSGAMLDLSWVKLDVSQKYNSMELQSAFLCCPLRSSYWWVGLALWPDDCLYPIAGAVFRLTCMAISPFPQGRRTLEWCWALSGLSHCQACDIILDELWPRTYWRGKFIGGHWCRAHCASKMHGLVWQEIYKKGLAGEARSA